MKAYRRIGAGNVQIHQDTATDADVVELYVPVGGRGRGIARRLMAATCKDADREGVTLWLVPLPFAMYEDDDTVHMPTLTHKQLVKFYRRFGFRFVSGRVNTMRRKPSA